MKSRGGHGDTPMQFHSIGARCGVLSLPRIIKKVASHCRTYPEGLLIPGTDFTI